MTKMGSQSSASAAGIFLTLNILLFALVPAGATCADSPTPKPSKPKSPPPTTPTPYTPTPTPTPKPVTTPSTTPTPALKPITPPSTSKASCPRDVLKLGVCANLVGGLVGVVVGTPPYQPCCTLIQGLADLEAAVCLCTAIRANILGSNLNIPVSLSLILNNCGKKLPSDFHCY